MECKMLLLVFFASFANSWAWYGQDQNGFMIMMMPMKAPVMNKAPVEESNVQEQPVHMPEMMMAQTNNGMVYPSGTMHQMAMEVSKDNSMMVGPMEVAKNENMMAAPTKEFSYDNKMMATPVETESEKMSVSMMEKMMNKWVEMMVKMKAMKKPAPMEMKLEKNVPTTGYQPPVEMMGGCSHVGEFLPTGDQCSFYQCTYGATGAVGGAIQVVPVEMGCPPGTAVDTAYTGGDGIPCTYSTACPPPVTKVVETSQPEEQKPMVSVYMARGD